MLLAEIFFCSSLLSFITTWSTYMILPQPLAKGPIIKFLTTISAGIDIFLSQSKRSPNPPDVVPPTPTPPPVPQYQNRNVSGHVESCLTQSFKISRCRLFLNRAMTKISSEQSPTDDREVILNTWLFYALPAALLIILILLFATCRTKSPIVELEISHPPSHRLDNNRKRVQMATRPEVIPGQPTIDQYFRKTSRAGSSRAIRQPQNPLPQAAAGRLSTPPTTDVKPLKHETKVVKQVMGQIFEAPPGVESTSISDIFPNQLVLDAALSWLGKYENSVPPASSIPLKAGEENVPAINIGNDADGAGDDSLDSLFDEPKDAKQCAVPSQEENEKVAGDVQHVSRLRTSGITGTNPAKSSAARENISPLLLPLSSSVAGAVSGIGSSFPDTTEDESVRRARLRRLFPRSCRVNTKGHEMAKVACERDVNRSEALDSGRSLSPRLNRAPQTAPPTAPPTDSSGSPLVSPRLPPPKPPKKPFLRSSASRFLLSEPRPLLPAPPLPISIYSTSSARTESALLEALNNGEKRLAEDSEAAIAPPLTTTVVPDAITADQDDDDTASTGSADFLYEDGPPFIRAPAHVTVATSQPLGSVPTAGVGTVIAKGEDEERDLAQTVQLGPSDAVGEQAVSSAPLEHGSRPAVEKEEICPSPIAPVYHEADGYEDASPTVNLPGYTQAVQCGVGCASSGSGRVRVPLWDIEVAPAPEDVHSEQPTDSEEVIGPSEQPENSENAPREENATANDEEWDAMFQAEFAEVDMKDAIPALATKPVPQQPFEDQEALATHGDGDLSMTDADAADSIADMDPKTAYPEPSLAVSSGFMGHIPVPPVQSQGFSFSFTSSNNAMPIQVLEDPPSSMELDIEQPAANQQVAPTLEQPDIAMAEQDEAMLPPQPTSNNTTYMPPVANANAPDISMGDVPLDSGIVLAPSTPIRSPPYPQAVSPQTQLRLALDVPIEDSPEPEPEPEPEPKMDINFDHSAEATRKAGFEREPPPPRPIFATSPTKSIFQLPAQIVPAPVFSQTPWPHQTVPLNPLQSGFSPTFPTAPANRTFPQTTPLAGYGFVEREKNESHKPQALPTPAPKAGRPMAGGLRPPGHEQYKEADDVADYGDTDDDQQHSEQGNDEQRTGKQSGHDCWDKEKHKRDVLDGSDEDDNDGPPQPASGGVAFSSSSSRATLKIPPPYNSNTPGPGQQPSSPSTPRASRRNQTRADGRVIATPRRRIFTPLPTEHPLAITPISAPTPSASSSIPSSDVVSEPSTPPRQDEDRPTDTSYPRVLVDVPRSGYEVQDQNQAQRLDQRENAYGSSIDTASAIAAAVRRSQQSRPQAHQPPPQALPAGAQACPDPFAEYLGMSPETLSALAAARGVAYNSFAQTAPESTLCDTEAQGEGTMCKSHPPAPGDASDSPQVMMTTSVLDGPSVGKILSMLATQSPVQHSAPEGSASSSALSSAGEIPGMPGIDEFLLPGDPSYAPFNLINMSLDPFNPHDPYKEDQLRRDMLE